MSWDQSKDLLQLQVEPSFKAKLQQFADQDDRSLASECIWLIKQGIRRRERIEAFEDPPEDKGVLLGWDSGIRKRKRKPEPKKTGSGSQ